MAKVEKTKKETDIAETKELIKLEIMGNVDKTGDYTNSDVITAIEKITGQIVNEGEEFVMSKKNNSVPISDLWKVKLVIYFPKIFHWAPQEYVEIPFKEGQVWTEEFLKSIEEEAELKNCMNYCIDDEGIEIMPDWASTVWIIYNGVKVKKGDPLIPNAQYEPLQL